jgi:isopentenyl diphosphate isomerase/L-lactate dehydrogenase-like FMN-dependent dehydrogenase
VARALRLLREEFERSLVLSGIAGLDRIDRALINVHDAPDR